MAQLFTLGGNRIGSGQKQKVELHNFGMNSFNLEQDFKSSLAPGILYPFIKMVGTNHGTFDIDLDTFVRTLPTKGPLFGSFKLQIDLYSVPFRLYQGVLHNNPMDIGLNMAQVYLPKIALTMIDGVNAPKVAGSNEDNYQVNESALMKYLGLSGIGKVQNYYYQNPGTIKRKIQCVPILAYYDIFKCYYSNKQEENAYVITPGEIKTYNIFQKLEQGEKSVQYPYFETYEPYEGQELQFFMELGSFNPWYLKFTIKLQEGQTDDIKDFIENNLKLYNQQTQKELYIFGSYGNYTIQEKEADTYEIEWYCNSGERRDIINGLTNIETETSVSATLINNKAEQYTTADIELKPFKLKNIDKMRYALLKENEIGSEFVMGKPQAGQPNPNWTEESGEDGTGLPYSALFKTTDNGISWNAFQQNGLVVKTYQSDLFNNWLDTEFIDGPNGISAITAVDTTSGSFTMDTLNLAEKFYELLNRILISGGTYQDWQDAVYGEGAVRMCETPMYIGGMAAEIMFEEVIATTENGDVDQALGSLGGKGTQVNKKGGNNIHVKLDEPGYVMGIVSITPRICYSQGNDWDLTELNSLDDLHKPSLDGIGFQPLMIEQMAWWNTQLYNIGPQHPTGGIANRDSAGKQTAWINYQTAVDKCYGDFAKRDGYAFMVLNRNYEHGTGPGNANRVKDITTYIDPAKYNYAFAYSELSAQNFWVQIHSKVIARRKMGAQQLPNL